MGIKLFVGNLPWDVEEPEVEQLFKKYGEVQTVKLIVDRETGRCQGNSYLEMENGELAIQELNNSSYKGRRLRVNRARERDGR
ncbi:MAG: RNA-binding protein [Fibrobacteria bacterium]|nr:RNA-binding protein [Fibrobacteria bacterium]